MAKNDKLPETRPFEPRQPKVRRGLPDRPTSTTPPDLGSLRERLARLRAASAN